MKSLLGFVKCFIKRLGKKIRSVQPKTNEVLTREEFKLHFCADPVDLEAVEAFADEHGFDILHTSLALRSVRLSGTQLQMQKAFGANL